MGYAAVLIEADGGSRGNPGPAAYGAVLKDAATGDVIAEDGRTIGVASNNVAEYSGLIAGLRLAAEHAPEATVEVRMDSKLVVEQMSGRWKVKHPDMKSLQREAAVLAPAGTRYRWVPRAENSYADRLANEALDGLRDGVTVLAAGSTDSLIEELETPATEAAVGETPPPSVAGAKPTRGWSAPGSTVTTLILLRHGVTAHTVDKRFSGGLGGSNPGLSDDGRAQVRASAQWIAPMADRLDVVLASPVRRTRESAEIVGEVLGKPVVEEPAFAEMEFGLWDGLTFAEVGERYPDALSSWLGSLDVAPEGGESFRAVQRRVRAGLDRVLGQHAGKVVVVVSHVTPIKTLVAEASGAPLDSVFKMELAPASVSVVSFFEDPADLDDTGRPVRRGSMRLFNALPPGRDPFTAPDSTW